MTSHNLEVKIMTRLYLTLNIPKTGQDSGLVSIEHA